MSLSRADWLKLDVRSPPPRSGLTLIIIQNRAHTLAVQYARICDAKYVDKEGFVRLLTAVGDDINGGDQVRRLTGRERKLAACPEVVGLLAAGRGGAVGAGVIHVDPVDARP